MKSLSSSIKEADQMAKQAKQTEAKRMGFTEPAPLLPKNGSSPLDGTITALGQIGRRRR